MNQDSTGKNITYINGPVTYLVKGDDDILNINTTGGAVTLVLPNIKGSGFDYYRKNYYVNDIGGMAATNNITITGSGGDEVNAGSSAVITVDNGSVECLITNIDEWLVEGDGIPSGGSGTLTYGQTLFVDATYGSDATGTPYRFDKPYQTVQAAINAAAIFDIVYVRKGTYTGSMQFKNGVDIYCEADVVFSGVGFIDGGVACTCRVFGQARFSNGAPLTVTGGSNIDFHFDRAVTNSFFTLVNPVAGTANVNYFGNSITSTGTNGFGSTFRGPSNIKMFISSFYYSNHTPLFFRLGSQGGFSGNFYMECPDVRCTGTGTFDFGSGIRSAFNTSATATITLIGNITLTDTGVFLGYNAGINTGAGLIKVVGDITTNNCFGVLTDGQFGGTGQVVVTGSITSNPEILIPSHSGVQVFIQDGFLQTAGTGGSGALIDMGTQIADFDNNTVNIRNCRLYNSTSGNNIILKEGAGNVMNLYNCEGYAAGAGNFIYTTSAQNVGFHNVRSVLDNVGGALVTDTFSPSGFIYDTGFIMPLI